MQKKPTSQSGALNPRILLATALCSAGVLLAIFSFAASPPNGTLTTASGPVIYTGGPFVTPNVTAQVNGTPDCTAPMSCDDFALTISVPAGTDATKRVKVSVEWPISAADFDVYILQGANVVATSASSSDPEVAFLPAVSASYTIRVVPFAPAGQSYTGTISLEDIPAPPPPSGATPPRYQNYPPTPSDLAGADSAGEPSTGVDWNPNMASLKHDQVNTGGVAFFTANLNEFRVNFDDCSSPAGNLWEDVTSPTEGVTSLDPIGFVDHQTGRVFQSQLAGASSILAFSDNDGGTNGQAAGDWTQSQGSGQPAGVDHQTVGGGPYNNSSVPPPPPHPLYPNQVYYASQDIGTAFAARSDDGGLTFNAGVPMWNLTQCGGLHGHIKVGPDGTVYVPNKGCGGGQGVSVSTDNGLTWTVRTVPGSTPGDTDPSVGIGSDNTLYFGYQNGDGHPHIATSTNHGMTWIDRDVGQSFIKNTVFPEVVAGDGDRAAFGFLGTPEPGNYQATATFKGVWNFYIATTFDRGNTYTLVNATGNDPVQIGSICTGGTTCGGDRNLLDFNDLQVDKEGRVVAAYADGCVGPGCTAATANAHGAPYNESRSALSSILRQSGGPRLFATFDSQANCTENPLTCPATVPAAPRVNSVTGKAGITVHLDWSEPDNGGSPLTGYNVYRRASAGTFGAALATITIGCPACKTTFDDTTTVAGKSYFYKVTATNFDPSVPNSGEGTNCGEFPIVSAGANETPCLLPGLTILNDPQGDIITPIGQDTNPGWDLRKLSIAEPFAFAPDKLVFTLKVQNLTVLPQNTRWPIQFRVPGDPATLGRWVDMRSDPTQPAGVSFKYGTFVNGATYGAPSTVLGDADAGSTFSPDGTITIVISRSKIANPAVGQNLTGFLIRVRFGTDAASVTPDNMPSDLGPAGLYTVVGNEACSPNKPPVAALTATPIKDEAPLLVHFDASGSSDPDMGDMVTSYTFDFGDGSAPVTQASPTISHTYISNGNFRATVRVTDSHGQDSSNVAGVEIEVQVPWDKVASRKMHGTAGTFDIQLLPPHHGRLVTPIGIECRTGGMNKAHTIICTFKRTLVRSFQPTAQVSQGSGMVSSTAFGPAANQFTINLTGVDNAQHLVVDLDGVHDKAGAIVKDALVRMDVLLGDTNKDGTVSNKDVNQTNAQVGHALANGNSREDVTVDGQIDSMDVSTVQSQVGNKLP